MHRDIRRGGEGDWKKSNDYKNNRSGLHIPPGIRETELSNARMEELLSKAMKWVEKTNVSLMEIQANISWMIQKVESHVTVVK